ncbi:MAG: SIR2 family protein [Desulfitobacteriaceae bacterium]
MDKLTLINKFSEALYQNRATIFVGTGISLPSCGIGWYELLKPLAAELGISPNNDTDDFALISQYIVNSHVGNRGPLINEITEVLTMEYSLNEYHHLLRLINVSTIWTTNYDTFLEHAFGEFSIDVKVSDKDIARKVSEYQVEIIKMHGCIKSSTHEDIVITQEDYEDFFINRPATTVRLKNDLLKKTFLFIGYSYRDPDLNNIMVEARRLSGKATQQHFMVLKKEKDPEKRRRQDLWCNNLKRVGISCVLIDKWKELEEILLFIGQKSRGKTVYVVGSLQERGGQVARDLGKELASLKDLTLISGQAAGISNMVVSAFAEECINQKIDVNTRLRTFPNPYAVDPRLSDNRKLLPLLKKWRSRLLSSTQIVLVFDGETVTKAEIEVAHSLNCKIIPIFTVETNKESDLVKELMTDEEVISFLRESAPEYLIKLSDFSVTVKDVLECVARILGE